MRRAPSRPSAAPSLELDGVGRDAERLAQLVDHRGLEIFGDPRRRREELVLARIDEVLAFVAELRHVGRRHALRLLLRLAQVRLERARLPLQPLGEVRLVEAEHRLVVLVVYVADDAQPLEQPRQRDDVGLERAAARVVGRVGAEDVGERLEVAAAALAQPRQQQKSGSTASRRRAAVLLRAPRPRAATVRVQASGQFTSSSVPSSRSRARRVALVRELEELEAVDGAAQTKTRFFPALPLVFAAATMLTSAIALAENAGWLRGKFDAELAIGAQRVLRATTLLSGRAWPRNWPAAVAVRATVALPPLLRSAPLSSASSMRRRPCGRR